MCFRKAATKNREVLREYINKPAINSAVSRNHTVARIHLFLHTKVAAAMGDKFPYLLKRPFVKQQLQRSRAVNFPFLC